eukprot:14887175-Alexandrium_andersonii.AAC.1
MNNVCACAHQVRRAPARCARTGAPRTPACALRSTRASASHNLPNSPNGLRRFHSLPNPQL